MLVLTRKPRETIHIADNIPITVIRTKNGSVQIGIEAPREIRILRGELVRAKRPGGCQCRVIR